MKKLILLALLTATAPASWAQAANKTPAQLAQEFVTP